MPPPALFATLVTLSPLFHSLPSKFTSAFYSSVVISNMIRHATLPSPPLCELAPSAAERPVTARRLFVFIHLRTLPDSAHSYHSTPLSRPLFSYICALFCTPQIVNPFVFKQFRTLCEKHGGVGGGTMGMSNQRFFPALSWSSALAPAASSLRNTEREFLPARQIGRAHV